jgi:hypothetical protein
VLLLHAASDATIAIADPDESMVNLIMRASIAHNEQGHYKEACGATIHTAGKWSLIPRDTLRAGLSICRIREQQGQYDGLDSGLPAPSSEAHALTYLAKVGNPSRLRHPHAEDCHAALRGHGREARDRRR